LRGGPCRPPAASISRWSRRARLSRLCRQRPEVRDLAGAGHGLVGRREADLDERRQCRPGPPCAQLGRLYEHTHAVPAGALPDPGWRGVHHPPPMDKSVRRCSIGSTSMDSSPHVGRQHCLPGATRLTALPGRNAFPLKGRQTAGQAAGHFATSRMPSSRWVPSGDADFIK
jgi:hypothetical protein